MLSKIINQDSYDNDKTKKLSIVDQFKNACNVNDGENSKSLIDYILHSLSFGWKVSNIG
jgi:hypothetical protein